MTATPSKKEQDTEWAAHEDLLFGKFTENADQQLRQIIQYADSQSGSFYPAGMHVQLIKKVFAQQHQKLLERLLDQLPPELPHGKHYNDGYNQAMAEVHSVIQNLIKENT